MTVFQNTLSREIDDISEQLQKLNDLGQMVQTDPTVASRAALEKNYHDDSLSAKVSDSKTQIQCIVDRIIEFTNKRQFYQIFQATYEVIELIREHQKNISEHKLNNEIFTSIRKGLAVHRESLEVMKNAAANLVNLDIFNGNNNKKDSKRWAENLEVLGEKLEDNLPFFSSEVFNSLEAICQSIVLKCRNKDSNGYKYKREDWRRRMRYSAGFILNLIESARDDAIEEDKEVIQDFLNASQSSFKNIWEDEKDS